MLMNYLLTGKIKIMKTILLLSFAFLIMRCGTDQGENKNFDYTIKNESGMKIELVPYYNGQISYINKLILNQNEIINLKKEVSPPYNDGLLMSSFFINTPSSGNLTHVEVVFNNTKKIIYQECTETNPCFNQTRNIFNPIYNDEQIETYTITSEDFQNATDCNGNCY